jgi:hypothetical protein
MFHVRGGIVFPIMPRNFAVNFQQMDIMKMLEELKAEREGIEQAILVLERIASGRSKRRGRPPAWMKTIKRRGRPKGSKNKPKHL